MQSSTSDDQNAECHTIEPRMPDNDLELFPARKLHDAIAEDSSSMSSSSAPKEIHLSRHSDLNLGTATLLAKKKQARYNKKDTTGTEVQTNLEEIFQKMATIETGAAAASMPGDANVAATRSPEKIAMHMSRLLDGIVAGKQTRKTGRPISSLNDLPAVVIDHDVSPKRPSRRELLRHPSLDALNVPPKNAAPRIPRRSIEHASASDATNELSAPSAGNATARIVRRQSNHGEYNEDLESSVSSDLAPSMPSRTRYLSSSNSSDEGPDYDSCVSIDPLATERDDTLSTVDCNSEFSSSVRSHNSSLGSLVEVKNVSQTVDETTASDASQLDTSNLSASEATGSSALENDSKTKPHPPLTPPRDKEPDSNATKAEQKKKVRFDKVNVRTYEQILCDNPGCVSGPSIGIGWNYKPEEESIDIDLFERMYSSQRRYGSQLLIPCNEREKIMLKMGFSKKDVIKSIRKKRKVRQQRFRSSNNVRVEKKIEKTLGKAQKKVGKAQKKVSKIFVGNNYKKGGSNSDNDEPFVATQRNPNFQPEISSVKRRRSHPFVNPSFEKASAPSYNSSSKNAPTLPRRRVSATNMEANSLAGKTRVTNQSISAKQEEPPMQSMQAALALLSDDDEDEDEPLSSKIEVGCSWGNINSTFFDVDDESKSYTPRRTRASEPSTASKPLVAPKRRKSSSVRFDKIHVRSYEQVLSDNPCSVSGPSIGIGWKYRTEGSMDIERFECLKQQWCSQHLRPYDYNNQDCYGPNNDDDDDDDDQNNNNNLNRRPVSYIVLSKEERERIALLAGYTRKEMVQNVREKRKVNHQRIRTVNNMKAEKLQYAVEKAQRKVSKIMRKGGRISSSRSKEVYQ